MTRKNRMEYRRGITFLAVCAGLLLIGATLQPAYTRAALDDADSKTLIQTTGDVDFSAIDTYIKKALRDSQVPGGSLAIVQGEQIVHLQGYGKADPSGTPVTPQTPFLIGGISKTLTSLAVIQLVEQGKINLDDPVQKYIPWFKTADKAKSSLITIQHLLNQTSGIASVEDRRLDAMSRNSTLDQLVNQMNQVPITSTPGRYAQDSNWNALVLGLLVEQVSGKSFEDYIHENIFSPLQMENSHASQAEAEQNRLAVGYRWMFGFPVSAQLTFPIGQVPAGFITSSAEDLAHFLAASLNQGSYQQQAILSPEMMALMHSPFEQESEPTYSMGWQVINESDQTLLIREGAWANYYSVMLLDPKTSQGLVLLTNASNLFSPKPAYQAAINVLHMLNGTEIETKIPVFWIWYLGANLILFGITLLVIWPIIFLGRWSEKLSENPPRDTFALIRGVFFPLALDFILPYYLFVMIPSNTTSPIWPQISLMQPDFRFWITGIAYILLFKGAFRTFLALKVMRQPVGATKKRKKKR